MYETNDGEVGHTPPSYILVSVEVASELLEDGLLRIGVSLEVVALLHLLECLLLVLREGLRHVDADVDHQVAVAVAVTLNGRQSLASQTESLAWLCARFYLDLPLAAADGRNLHLTAECSCGAVEEKVVDKVLSVANECVARLLRDV